MWDVSQLRMYDEDNEEVQPSMVISSKLHSDGSTYHHDNVLISSGRWEGRADLNGDLYIGFEFNGIIDVTKNLLKLDEGKKIKISQKGNTPKFTQK